MKIPETTVNVGAYYANEENGQWQVSVFFFSYLFEFFSNSRRACYHPFLLFTNVVFNRNGVFSIFSFQSTPTQRKTREGA